RRRARGRGDRLPGSREDEVARIRLEPLARLRALRGQGIRVDPRSGGGDPGDRAGGGDRGVAVPGGAERGSGAINSVEKHNGTFVMANNFLEQLVAEWYEYQGY